MLTLLDDLKEVALDYAELVGDDLEMVDNKFEKLIDEIKSSEIFEDLNLDEMLEGQTLEKADQEKQSLSLAPVAELDTQRLNASQTRTGE